MDQPTTPPPAEGIDDFLGVEPPSRRAFWIKWGLVAVGVALLILLAIRLFSGEAAPQYATRPVERDDLTVTISATGNLQPTNQVDVGSELSGLIATVSVDNNDLVAKGQVLARLDPRRFADTVAQTRASLAASKANVGTAQATAAQSRANLSRLEQVFRLSGGKVPSGTELDAGRADYARAQAGVRAAIAQVAQVEAQLRVDLFQLSRSVIVSPVNGVVLKRSIEPGQTVAASFNAPVLFTIAEDLSRMKLEAKVDEADVGQVKAGQGANFSVDAFPGRTFPARIERVDVGANATGATTTSTTTAANTVIAYTAVLSVANPDLSLRPGMTATADIVTMRKANVLLVPNAALRFSPDRAAAPGGRSGVTAVLVPGPPRRGNRAAREVAIGRGSRQTIYVLGEDGQPQPVQVTVGETDGSRTEVSGQGVREGMKVVTGQLATGDQAGSGPGSGRPGGGRRSGGGGGGQ